MFWNILLVALFLISAVISGLALFSGSGHPRHRGRTH